MNNKSNLVFMAILCLFPFGFFHCPPATGAEPEPYVIAVEWLPLAAHGRILNAYQNAANNEWAKVRRVNVMGEEDMLHETLANLPDRPSTIVFAFGQTAADAAARLLPAATTVALLTAQPPSGPNVVYIDSEPGAETVWRAADDLAPGVSRLGVLYTAGYAPNERLAQTLERHALDTDRFLVRATVPHGMCRSESDFEIAMEALAAAGGCDVLYVPDDPNSSRFAATVFNLAGDAPTIGTENTRGKGCCAAFTRDYDELGRALADVVKATAHGEIPRRGRTPVEPRLQKRK